MGTLNQCPKCERDFDTSPIEFVKHVKSCNGKKNKVLNLMEKSKKVFEFKEVKEEPKTSLPKEFFLYYKTEFPHYELDAAITKAIEKKGYRHVGGCMNIKENRRELWFAWS